MCRKKCINRFARRRWRLRYLLNNTGECSNTLGVDNPHPHMLFPHPRTHMGVQPHAISSLIEIELWDKDQTNPWDVLSESNGTRVDIFRSYLDPSRSGQSKKDSDLRMYRFRK